MGNIEYRKINNEYFHTKNRQQNGQYRILGTLQFPPTMRANSGKVARTKYCQGRNVFPGLGKLIAIRIATRIYP